MVSRRNIFLGLLAAAVFLPAAEAPNPAPYSATSPHWPHIRTMITDFRIRYVNDPGQQKREYEWTAQHYDRVMGGDIAQFKKRNPRLQHYIYALNWTVPLTADESLASVYYGDMRKWFKAHPDFRIEDAFLHDRRCAEKIERCRVVHKIWDSQRWIVNPKDPGLRAYQRDRFRRLLGPYSGFLEDGIFLDEHASGDILTVLKDVPLAEYKDADSYLRDIVALLREEREALGPGKLIMINTGTYVTEPNAGMIRAAGASHMENILSPVREMEERWSFIERMNQAGEFLDVVAGYDVPARFDAGNSDTPIARLQLFLLGAYYMISPADPEAMAMHVQAGWKEPFAKSWIPAQEVDVGAPLGPRKLYKEGTDPAGMKYHVWIREFERATVLVRPKIYWKDDVYDGSTAVDVPLPAGSYVALRADGRPGPAAATLKLRHSEAVILLKRP